MSLVSHAFNAAVVGMILAPPSVAGDPSGASTNSEQATSIPRLKVRLGQVPSGLKMRRRYEPGKVPVVLIHGLWGFPQMWNQMIDDLEAEPALRERYQFWTFSYASGDSIPFSAHLLRQSLRQARRLFDPQGTDASFDRMVVVGHSLGGILAKMMAQGSGSRLWQTVCDRPIDKVAGPPEACRLLRQMFCYEPLPEVRRLVFIATPHRGSPLAGGLIRKLGTQICDRANRFREAREAVLAQNEPEIFLAGFRRETPTSVSELAAGHSLLLALSESGIDPSVRSHSIIADLRNPPAPGASDGIVPYWSSHLECAGSEVLFRGNHLCLNDPAVILETRRILREHAGIGPASLTDRVPIGARVHDEDSARRVVR